MSWEDLETGVVFSPPIETIPKGFGVSSRVSLGNIMGNDIGSKLVVVGVNMVLEELVPLYQDVLQKEPLLIFSGENPSRVIPSKGENLSIVLPNHKIGNDPKFPLSSSNSSSKVLSLQNRNGKKGIASGGLATSLSPIKIRISKKKLEGGSDSSSQVQSMQDGLGSLRGVKALVRGVKCLFSFQMREELEGAPSH